MFPHPAGADDAGSRPIVLTGRGLRNVRLGVAGGVAVLLAGVMLPSASADPEPTIAGVGDRVSQLHHEAEQAIERHNTINERVEDARADLAAVRDNLRAQRQRTERLRRHVEQLVLAQVDSTGVVSTTTQLLDAEDPDAFLIAMVAMQSYSDQSAELLASYEGARARLDRRELDAATGLTEIADALEQASEEKALALEKAAAAEELLAELEAARAERIAAAAEASRDEARAEQPTTTTTGTGTSTDPEPPAAPPAAPPASGSAGTAVATALDQVGDAYVYGATGPDAFDCSGLTMYAWAAAGVSLPHSSSMQAGAGSPVDYSDLQPGDLVFYYSPISHVGMYIGNGQLVHAANESAPVEVVDVDLMPIATIRRVG